MENLEAAFTLPDSLPCSEVEFPVLIHGRMKANWKHILDESHKTMKEVEEYEQSKKEAVLLSPFLKTESEYIQKEIFVQLLPALEETLNKAKVWEAFTRPQCFFNGIDHIVQVLWNNNPRYPERKDKNLHLFNIPWVQQQLKLRPRPYYPKSWLWPEDYAATLIQKTVRQFFVQKDEEVQEMREFWRKLKLERKISTMNINPFLAKLFATQPHVHKKNA